MNPADERHLPDHESDPARTPGDGWAEEGGASHLGPATHIAAGRPEDEDDDGGAGGDGGAEEE